MDKPSPAEAAAVAMGDPRAGLVLYLDADLKIRFANRYCLDLIGHAPQDVVDRCLGELVDPGTLRYALDHVAELEKGNFRPRDYVLRTRDGGKTRVRIDVVADCDDDGRSVGYIARSASHASQHQLQGVNSLLNATLDKYLSTGSRLLERRQMDHTRRELVATANQELLTPLAAVIAALELLREGAEAKSADGVAGCIPIALDSAERLALAVSQWLDVERIGLGITPVRRDPLDLGELARGVVRDCRPLAESRGVELECSSVAALVSGDTERLAQIVHGLVADAIARSPDKVRVTVERNVGRAILTIDNGVVTPDASMGLRLALAKALVSRLGGTLSRAGGPEGPLQIALPLDAESRRHP
jgi:two-component system sensor histidine kinase/response regulator